MHKETKKITVGFVISWILGVIFGLAGLGYLTSSDFVPGIVLLLMAAVLLPPANKFVKKRWNLELSKGIKIVLIIAGIVILSMVGEEISVDTNTEEVLEPKTTDEKVTQKTTNTKTETTTKTEQKEEAPPEATKEVVEEKVTTKTEYSMNENINVDYLTYKVTKVESFNEMGTSFMKKETNGKFVKVYVELTNNAMETKQIFSPRFNIVDSKGRKYDRLSDDMFYITDALELGKQVQPGLTTSGAVVFELPTDSDSLKLRINGDWLSVSEVTITLSNIKDIGKDTTQAQEQDDMMNDIMGDAQNQMDDLMKQLG